MTPECPSCVRVRQDTQARIGKTFPDPEGAVSEGIHASVPRIMEEVRQGLLQEASMNAGFLKEGSIRKTLLFFISELFSYTTREKMG
ncbi:hypothetical protein [Novacetimonas pomaceti]|uniref:hypothetical protein n=1 Tax=Novacetimonas pomaceti TaxID=2021998 RepID=UPI001057680A|nr:hypothetical protein [Novacetimonas pomaceti]